MEHTGFYVSGIDRLKSAKNPYCENDENIYETADIFLAGSCQIFARLLSEEFGYRMCKIEKPRLHIFCMKTIGGVNWYIDVRGITTSFDEFKAGIHPSCQESDIRDYTDDDGDDPAGEEFAQFLLKKYWADYVATI